MLSGFAYSFVSETSFGDIMSSAALAYSIDGLNTRENKLITDYLHFSELLSLGTPLPALLSYLIFITMASCLCVLRDLRIRRGRRQGLQRPTSSFRWHRAAGCLGHRRSPDLRPDYRRQIQPRPTRLRLSTQLLRFDWS